MFNLLVKSSPWAPSRDKISAGRVLQYTADHLLEQYAPEGKLLLDLLSRLPTVFADLPELGESWRLVQTRTATSRLSIPTARLAAH